MPRRRKKETTVVPEPDLLKLLAKSRDAKARTSFTSGKINQIIKAPRVKK